MAIWSGPKPDPAKLTQFESQSMAGHLGIEFVEVGDDFLRARMPVNARTCQPFGRLHGGASVALAETVCSVAANMTVDKATHLVVGMEINANHLRPAKSGYEEGKLVCIARMTAAVIPAGRM
jgi:1,4-dihydroxy-2-naphthoyl-CoA hydrolase